MDLGMGWRASEARQPHGLPPADDYFETSRGDCRRRDNRSTGPAQVLLFHWLESPAFSYSLPIFVDPLIGHPPEFGRHPDGLSPSRPGFATPSTAE
jgi:hypothetical protein